MLNKIVGLLQRNPEVRLELRVHTDNVATKSRNKFVSQLRAQRMVDYIADSGINVKRLTAIGFGEERPIRSNLRETGRKQNRRIEFKLITK
jgi:outer membrane protein OmpA-like peptidoglycan-associated protein